MIGNPVLHHTQQKIQQTVLILEGAFSFFILWLRHSIAILFYTSELRSISETPRSLQITSRSPLQIDFFSQLLIPIPPAHSIATTIHSVVVGFFKF